MGSGITLYPLQPNILTNKQINPTKHYNHNIKIMLNTHYKVKYYGRKHLYINTASIESLTHHQGKVKDTFHFCLFSSLVSLPFFFFFQVLIIFPPFSIFFLSVCPSSLLAPPPVSTTTTISYLTKLDVCLDLVGTLHPLQLPRCSQVGKETWYPLRQSP